ncbi:MAG: DUF4290 domain-containing protein [Bacteroidetes bacterium]|nr:DUF4290 domain-containing protein [Bacteroidota bacterium]MBU1718185.1 DUF4290 domain-containing protein [Bacteroidota bacterium]
MEYNTTRPALVMREYGRNVQKMVDHLVNIPDKEERTKAAKSIIQIMSQLNPQVKDINDYRQKLWDHLQAISDYTLEVEAPCELAPKPDPEKRPERLQYSNRRDIRFSHYGKILQDMVAKAIEFEEGPEKDALVELIANQMKKLYLSWNRDSVTDELIHDQLAEISSGKLKVPEHVKLASNSDLNTRAGTPLSASGSNTINKQRKRKPMKPPMNSNRMNRNPGNGGSHSSNQNSGNNNFNNRNR